MNYDLEERTVKFSEDLINMCKLIKKSHINENIIKQLLRSGTSVGANYYEANGATSKSDFRSKINICKKEAKETMYWLRLLTGTVNDSLKERIMMLWKENIELTLIFAK